MRNYRPIHIWDFHPTATFLRLKYDFRLQLFARLKSKIGCLRNLANLISELSLKYYAKKIFPSPGNLCGWAKGRKMSEGKIKLVRIPLWALIEFSKVLAKSKDKQNKVMQEIERNVEDYANCGKSHPIIKPKLPLHLTPEMVSIIFHFLGDGHIGKKGVYSSYRQMNQEGLTNFLLKLKNIFGSFEYNKNEFNNGKVILPKIITDFYNYYFNLPNTDTFESYVPDNIKSLSKEFLVASLTAFMIDEANIGETITVYSKNPKLISGVREMAVKCGYECKEVKKKYRYGAFDSYRFLISSNSYLKLSDDISGLTKNFPLCGLAHKTEKFKILIKQRQRGVLKRQHGVTKNNILKLLRMKPRITSELVELLNIGNSTVREHLHALEKKLVVVRKKNLKRNAVWAVSRPYAQTKSLSLF
jgi:hypothetical protein